MLLPRQEHARLQSNHQNHTHQQQRQLPLAEDLEGKELRLGATTGPLWAVLTTSTSNGSVGAMHDSLNPLTGLVPMAGMWLNETFGGVGVGMINMFLYIVVAVFVAGMMVGRTPEYLGHRIEGGEMRLVQRAGGDHRHLRPRLGPTDNIGPRPREGEGTRIVGDHSLNQRRDLIAPPVGEIKIPNEGNHADAPVLWRDPCLNSSVTFAGAPHHGRSIALAVSNRLQPIAAAVLCLMAAQLVTASCTPEPAPYASRVAVER